MKSTEESIRIEDIGGVIKKGWLIKRGKIVTSWKKRYFVLTNLVLYYFDSDKNNAKMKGFLDISQNELCTTSRADLECLKTPSFKIKTPNRILFAYSEELKEVESWIEEIQNIFENRKKKKRNLDQDIDENKVKELVDKVEVLKKKIEEYLYCKIGTSQMNDDEKERLYKDKEFEKLVLDTNLALEDLSFAVQSFEEKMKRVTQRKEEDTYRSFIESRKTFVKEIRKVDTLKNIKKRSNTIIKENTL